MTSEDLLGPVTVTDVAHGGHCVARFDGRVLFVRHALPGEVVRVRITDARHDRFWRADAMEIMAAAPHRRTPPCPIFRPGGCGGCDFQHATEPAQRELKSRVVADQLARLGGFHWSGQVEEVPPVFGWRTRMRYQLTTAGPGLRAHRSHRVIPLPAEGCRLATVNVREVLPEVPASDAGGSARSGSGGSGSERSGSKRSGSKASEVLVVSSADEVRTGTPDDVATVTERAGERAFGVALNGFWQVHPGAADVLVAAVVDGLDPQPGERAFDLYCGVGVFAGALIDRGVRVQGVESGRTAAAHARRNVPEATITVGRVERVLGRLPRRTDLVVLDPPRAGAGRAILDQIASRRPRAIAYIACDPAALARDVRHATDLGWEVASLRAYDLFPQTHHVECVAILIP